MSDVTFTVATFDSIDDSKIDVVEGNLQYDEAKALADKIWSTNKYFGVEIIDNDQNNMEPIVFCISKDNTQIKL